MSYNTKEFLKAALVRGMPNMDQDYLIQACRWLMSYIVAVIKVEECSFIE